MNTQWDPATVRYNWSRLGSQKIIKDGDIVILISNKKKFFLLHTPLALVFVTENLGKGYLKLALSHPILTDAVISFKFKLDVTRVNWDYRKNACVWQTPHHFPFVDKQFGREASCTCLFLKHRTGRYLWKMYGREKTPSFSFRYKIMKGGRCKWSSSEREMETGPMLRGKLLHAVSTGQN